MYTRQVSPTRHRATNVNDLHFSETSEFLRKKAALVVVVVVVRVYVGSLC